MDKVRDISRTKINKKEAGIGPFLKKYLNSNGYVIKGCDAKFRDDSLQSNDFRSSGLK